MKKLELTCTYSEWRKNRNSQIIDTLCEETARLLELQIKSISNEDTLSCEEKNELKKLEKSSQNNLDNKKYTDLCHEITDKCLNPVNADIDYEEIGRLQFEVERLKYPCVLPEDEI